MAHWKAAVVAEIRRLATEYRIIITDKADQELRELRSWNPNRPDIPELYEEDVRDLLLALEPKSCIQRVESIHTGELLYVFRPEFAETVVYLKVAVREDCVVISLHEDR